MIECGVEHISMNEWIDILLKANNVYSFGSREIYYNAWAKDRTSELEKIAEIRKRIKRIESLDD